MSGETDRDPSPWTIESLKALVDQRFIDQEKAVQAALAAAEKAVQKAEVASEKRLDSVNEFRGQLADQAQSFMRQDVADSRFHAVEARLSIIENFVAQDTGKTAGAADIRVWALAAISFITVVIVVANYFAR